MRCVNRFSQNRSGSTAIEYALIAALIAVAIFAALHVTGDSAEARFHDVEGMLSEDGTDNLGSGSGGGSSGGSPADDGVSGGGGGSSGNGDAGTTTGGGGSGDSGAGSPR